MALPNGAFVLRDEFKGSLDPIEAALATLAEIPARRRIVVAGEIAEESGNEDYRVIGRKVGAIADRAIFVGRTKTFRLYRTGAAAAGLARERIEHARNAHDVIALLRDDLEAGDVVLTSGRWQHALGRVGLALSGREVRCRADPCPFKRMLCDVCPFLDQPFTGLPGRPLRPEA
jgi:UDP-N-acetylmuramyl pentapeptide synthase